MASLYAEHLWIKELAKQPQTPWIPLNDAQKAKTIKEMIQLADDYEASSETLSEKIYSGHASGANHLVLLALEIRLKCAVLSDTGSRPRGHDYYCLWNKLNPLTQSCVLESAHERFAGHVDYSDLEGVLKALKKVFEIGRYGYEINDQRSPEEAKGAGDEWLKLGGNPSDADLAYYPFERDGLLHGLKDFLASQP